MYYHTCICSHTCHIPRKYPPSSPVHETKRCDGYRKLHAQLPTALGNKSSQVITLTDIPKVDEMLACLHSSKFFTSFDLRSGYYHIKLSPEMRHKSAFTTIFGKYKFLKMLFGIAQGQAYFTVVTQKVFGQFNDFCFFHVDNVMVPDSNDTDHFEHLKMKFKKIREAV